MKTKGGKHIIYANEMMNDFQKGIYYEEKLNDCKSANNIGGVIQFEAMIDLVKLERVLNQVIEKQPFLRSHLIDDEEPRIEFFNHKMCELKITCCESVTSYDEHLNDVFGECNTLQRNCLFYVEACIVQESVRLIVRFHHIISDGYSMSTFVSDICEFWSEDVECVQPVEVDIACSKLDEEYYKMNKDKYLVTSNKASVKKNIYKSKRTIRKFPNSLSNALETYKKNHSVFVFPIFLYTYSYSLMHFFKEEKMLIGVPTSTVRQRNHRPIGMFVNIVPFIADQTDYQDSNGVEKVKIKWFDALRHSRFPYALLKNLFGTEFEGYDYTFNYLDHDFPKEIGGVPVSFVNQHPGYQTYRMQGLVEKDNKDTYSLSIDWDEETYTEEWIDYFIDYYFEVLKHVCSEEKISLRSKLVLPIDMELIHKCENVNRSAIYSEGYSPFELFQNNVINTPDHIAVFGNQGSDDLTYEELWNLTKQVIVRLKDMGIHSNDCVIVDLEHNKDEIPIIYGLLYMGCTMVPVNQKEWNQSRTNAVLEQVNPVLCIGRTEQISNQYHTVRQDSFFGMNQKEDIPIEQYCRDKFNAYIIFTSGTTGQPKGVVVSNGALKSYIEWAGRSYHITEKDCMPIYSTLTFDFTLTSIYLPLCFGASVKLYEDTKGEYPLFDILQDQVITVVKVTPSHMNMIAIVNEPIQSNMRLTIAGGENLSYHTLANYANCFKKPFICCNEYGPTEATIGCITYFTNQFEEKGSVPIGLPNSNTKIRIVDCENHCVPCFVKGEILIGGECLSEGYWNNPQITADKFIHLDGELWYKSGDLGWYNSKGYIEYGGRIDTQKKYHGYRIELEEITNIVMNDENIVEAVTILVGEGDDVNIALFYVVKREETNIDQRINRILMNNLPAYLPVTTYEIKEIPLTSNGKLNERELNNIVKNRSNERQEVEDICCDETILSDLIFVLQKSLNIEGSIHCNQTFIELGGDSIKSFSCMRMLQNMGYAIEYNYFRLPLSIKEIAIKLHKEIDDPATDNQEGMEFEPTALIRRFLTHCNEIEKVSHTVVLDIKEDMTLKRCNALIRDLYDSFHSLHFNVTEDHTKLFFNKDIAYPSVIVTNLADLSNHCYFDIHSEGLFKMFFLEDIKQYAISIHHLAVDFVSWEFILRQINYFFSDETDVIRKKNEFMNYCKLHHQDEIFHRHNSTKTHFSSITWKDSSLVNRIHHCEQTICIRKEDLFKRVICELYSNHSHNDSIVLELEHPGRDNGESDTGWYTSVIYEKYISEENRFMKTACQEKDHVIRFNYIPFTFSDRYSKFTINNEYSRFYWSCELDYIAEFDIIATQETINLSIRSTDITFLDYVTENMEGKLKEIVNTTKSVDIAFDVDEDVDLEDIRKLFVVD